MPFSFSWSGLFLMVWLGWWVWGRRTTEGKGHCHPYHVRLQTVNMTSAVAEVGALGTFLWPWGHWAHFSTIQLLLLPFPYCARRRHAQPKLRSGELFPTFLWAGKQHKLSGILLQEIRVSSLPLIYSIIFHMNLDPQVLLLYFGL